MSAIADDDEDFSMVAKQQPNGLRNGFQIDRQEMVGAIAELIRSSYAQAYLLSATPPHVLVADYSDSRAESLWFMLTPEHRL
jgi:hypothetical protein